ncbi:MAG TPA: 16S rRNA (cytosine(967)-C(5))-methyltransferase RsmB [Terriglobales bacterium]|jgi:16S rRNA (cytosine967-C5)-methyltransferase
MNAARTSGDTVSPARSAAFDILLRVEQTDAYAAELLHSAPFAQLSSVDHGLATELVMGVLRWKSLLDARLAQVTAKPASKLDLEVVNALRLGAYQLGWLERVPARAVIYDSVELVKRARKRSASAFVNAVLRKLASNPAHPQGQDSETVSQLAQESAHPEWLVERWVRAFGLGTARTICAYDQQIPRTVIRLDDKSAEQEMVASGVKLEAGEIMTSARRVTGGAGLGVLDRVGRIAIQDEGSQLVAALVGRGGSILDCCAAPGGKTSALAAQNPQAAVIAVELHSHRARLLRKLVRASNVRVIIADARQLPFAGGFERVLVDAPCSGTGTLGRNPDIKWRLTARDLEDLQARQLAILQSAMSCVAPGGRLVYSTCSLEAEENSEVIARALERSTSFRLIDCRERLGELKLEGLLIIENADALARGPYLQTIPGIHHCDGFFAAILEKLAG